MSEDTLRVVGLEVANFMRIKAARIKPDGSLVRIEGRNAAGKSAVLHSMSAALGGGKHKPEEPVLRGEPKATVKLDLGRPGCPDPEIVVERYWKPGGATGLKVTVDGVEKGAPQAILETLYDEQTFDPLAFTRMSPVKQGKLLLRVAGLDFTKQDTERDRLFKERTDANRDARAALARAGTIVAKPKPSEPIDIGGLADKEREARAHNSTVDAAGRAYVEADTVETALAAEVADCEATLQGLRETLVKAKVTVKETRANREMMQHVEVGDLVGEIAAAEAHNKAIESRTQWEAHDAEAKAKAKEAEAMTAEIEKIDADKARKLREAKFPMDGLGIGINGPTLDGLPFSQASRAQQMRAGVAMGLVGSRRARIMFVENGSLLDKDSFAQLAAIAEEFDAQVWVERVAENATPAAIFIEDGEIVDTE